MRFAFVFRKVEKLSSNGAVAKLVSRPIRIRKVPGSKPGSSTFFFPVFFLSRFFETVKFFEKAAFFFSFEFAQMSKPNKKQALETLRNIKEKGAKRSATLEEEEDSDDLFRIVDEDEYG